MHEVAESEDRRCHGNISRSRTQVKNSELKETVLAARMVCKLAAMPSQTKRTYVAQVERFAPMHVTIASEI